MGLAGPCSRLGVGLAFCLVVGVSLTSAAPATMPLPFTLSCRLSLIWLSFWLILLCLSCMHIPVRWLFLQLSQVRPSLARGRQRLAATHVSTWPMATGHVPRSQEELIQDTVWGNLWFDLSNKVLVLVYTAISLARRRTSLFGPAGTDAAEKTLLTLENCGELDSHLGSGFSRSIGKTDNTQLPHPRASAIRRAKFPKFAAAVQKGDTKAESKSRNKKSHKGWLFFAMADHWPPKGSPSEASLRDVVHPAAVGPFGTELCAPDLSRRTRICEPRASLAAYVIAVDMPFLFFIIINELAF